MMIFWFITAALAAIALAFVVPPLLKKPDKQNEVDNQEANLAVYRSQLSELEADLKNGLTSEEQYQADRDEIERRLLEDVSGKEIDTRASQAHLSRTPAYAVAVAIPLLAVILYLQLGNPTAVATTAPPRSSANAPPMAGGMTQERIQANVDALARRLEQNPTDLQGWIMLGRSYTSLEKFSEASGAYARATALKPDDADLLADYAFTLAMASGQRLAGRPRELIDKALKLDPENPKALELAGSAAMEAKDYDQAIGYWEKLLKKSPPNSELSRALTERIERAKSLR